MSRSLAVGAIAACAALLTSPLAHADRVEPVPVYGFYDVHVDFAQQTFNGVPTSPPPMESKTFRCLLVSERECVRSLGSLALR
jgi:hypothetical protein